MNQLLKESNHPFKTVEFDTIRLKDFMPAIDEAINDARKNINDIKTNLDTYKLNIKQI